MYSKEQREELLNLASKSENKMISMTESTGLKILDAIYMMTEVLREVITPRSK